MESLDCRIAHCFAFYVFLFLQVVGLSKRSAAHGVTKVTSVTQRYAQWHCGGIQEILGSCPGFTAGGFICNKRSCLCLTIMAGSGWVSSLSHCSKVSKPCAEFGRSRLSTDWQLARRGDGLGSLLILSQRHLYSRDLHVRRSCSFWTTTRPEQLGPRAPRDKYHKVRRSLHPVWRVVALR